MATSTDQRDRQATTSAIATGAVVLVGVAIAAFALELLADSVRRSVWYDPMLWSASGMAAGVTQAVLWSRSRRMLIPVGVLLLAGAAYGTNKLTMLAFLNETALAWVTGAVCVVTGSIWHLRKSS